MLVAAHHQQVAQAGGECAERVVRAPAPGADPPCTGKSGATTVWWRANGSITSCQFS